MNDRANQVIPEPAAPVMPAVAAPARAGGYLASPVMLFWVALLVSSAGTAIRLVVGGKDEGIYFRAVHGSLVFPAVVFLVMWALRHWRALNTPPARAPWRKRIGVVALAYILISFVSGTLFAFLFIPGDLEGFLIAAVVSYQDILSIWSSATPECVLFLLGFVALHIETQRTGSRLPPARRRAGHWPLWTPVVVAVAATLVLGKVTVDASAKRLHAAIIWEALRNGVVIDEDGKSDLNDPATFARLTRGLQEKAGLEATGEISSDLVSRAKTLPDKLRYTVGPDGDVKTVEGGLHHFGRLSMATRYEFQTLRLTLALRAGIHDLTDTIWSDRREEFPLTITSDNPRSPAIVRIGAEGVTINTDQLTVQGLEFRGVTTKEGMLRIEGKATLRDNLFVTPAAGPYFAVYLNGAGTLVNNRFNGMGLGINQYAIDKNKVARVEANAFDVRGTAILIAGASNPLITANRISSTGDSYLITAGEKSAPRLEGQDLTGTSAKAGALHADGEAKVSVVGGRIKARGGCILLEGRASVEAATTTIGHCGARLYPVALNGDATARISDSHFISEVEPTLARQVFPEDTPRRVSLQRNTVER